MSEIVPVTAVAPVPSDPMQALALAQTNALQHLSETKADKKEVDELRVANRQLEEQCAHLQAQMHQVHHNRDYWTAQALITALGLKLTGREKQIWGSRLTALSQELRIPKGKRPDDRFGTIGTYHPFICQEFCRRNDFPAPPAIKFAKDPR